MESEKIDAELQSLEKERLRAEIEKLSAETHEAKKPLVARPTFWASLLPILAATGTIFLAYKGNFFDAQTKLLDARRAELGAETANLETKKLILESELAELNTNITSASEKIQQLEKENKELVTRIALEPIRDSLKRLAKTAPRPYEESPGPALVEMIRGIEDKAAAFLAIEAELDAGHLGGWSKLVLLRALQEISPSAQANDRILDGIAGVLGDPEAADESLRMISERFDAEPEQYGAARCKAIGNYIGGPGLTPRLQYHLVNSYTKCKYLDMEEDFLFDTEAVKSLVRWYFLLQGSDSKLNDLECLELGNFVKIFSVNMADAFFAKCIYNLPEEEIYLSFLEQYVEGYESIDIPPSNVAGNQVLVWREFYEREIENMSVESVLLLR